MPIASTRALFHAATPQITSTATDAIRSWPRNRCLGAAKIANVLQKRFVLGKAGNSRRPVQLSLMTPRQSLSREGR